MSLSRFALPLAQTHTQTTRSLRPHMIVECDVRAQLRVRAATGELGARHVDVDVRQVGERLSNKRCSVVHVEVQEACVKKDVVHITLLLEVKLCLK